MENLASSKRSKTVKMETRMDGYKDYINYSELNSLIASFKLCIMFIIYYVYNYSNTNTFSHILFPLIANLKVLMDLDGVCES